MRGHESGMEIMDEEDEEGGGGVEWELEEEGEDADDDGPQGWDATISEDYDRSACQQRAVKEPCDTQKRPANRWRARSECSRNSARTGGGRKAQRARTRRPSTTRTCTCCTGIWHAASVPV